MTEEYFAVICDECNKKSGYNKITNEPTASDSEGFFNMGLNFGHNLRGSLHDFCSQECAITYATRTIKSHS